MKLNKVDVNVVSALKTEPKGMTLNEISEMTGDEPKKVFKSLRKLFEAEMIDCQERKYLLLKVEPPAE